ncbi:MAG: hypothetical protein QOI29_4780 [Mycobacterium sp.]|nr:hypothetical protein [Mycobacterium sp.]
MANEQNIKVDDARNVGAVSLRWVEMDSLALMSCHMRTHPPRRVRTPSNKALR